MDKLKHFFRTSLLGGVVVILPVAILVAVTMWVFRLVTGLIAPLTNLLISDSEFNIMAANVIVLVLVVAACFFVGVLVRTRLGDFIYRVIETRIFKIAPGYSLIKETVAQLFGSDKESPFSSVALAQIFCNKTLVTAFITDKHVDGSYTLFVPTGPNPTSGLIYHLDGRFVHPIDVAVPDAMRTIISCGAGSAKIMRDHIAGGMADCERDDGM